MANGFEMMRRKGVVPVINIEKVEYAVPLAQALIDGGLPLIEVTLRSDTSLKSIEAIHKAFPDMPIAAGTVLSPELAKESIDAGAGMIVAPGFQEKTVRWCVDNGIDILPGCVTPTEINAAVDMGLKCVKFFPAEQSGGLKAIELLAGPFKGLTFVPTGGITYDNLGVYLSSSKVLACGGSFMAKADVIRRGDWDAITQNCRRAMDLSLGFSLSHVGINHENDEEAMRAAQLLCRMFRLPVNDRPRAVFAGPYVENMKAPSYGEKGHIGFKCNSLVRAVAWLEEEGFAFDPDGKSYDASGNLRRAYLKDPIGGFAIHLI